MTGQPWILWSRKLSAGRSGRMSERRAEPGERHEALLQRYSAACFASPTRTGFSSM